LQDCGKTDIFEIRTKIHWHCFTDCPTFVTVFVTQSINGTVLLSAFSYGLALIFVANNLKIFWITKLFIILSNIFRKIAASQKLLRRKSIALY
jgi:hypothetical protein